MPADLFKKAPEFFWKRAMIIIYLILTGRPLSAAIIIYSMFTYWTLYPVRVVCNNMYETQNKAHAFLIKQAKQTVWHRHDSACTAHRAQARRHSHDTTPKRVWTA